MDISACSEPKIFRQPLVILTINLLTVTRLRLLMFFNHCRFLAGPCIEFIRIMPPIRRKRKIQNKRKKVTVSTVKILDLNDHCLLDIFRYLSPYELCAVKDTCHRFRGLAKKQVELFYKTEELIVSNRLRCEYSHQIKVFFKFCSVLTKLNISIEGMNWHQENDVIFATIRHCNPKLDSLALTDTNFEMAFHRLLPLFRNLRRIKLEYFNNDFRCDIRREETIKDLFKACTNAEELYFGAKVSAMGSCYQGIFLQQKFKNVRSLELSEVRDLDLNNLKLFLKLNPKIQRLSLKCCVRIKELNDFKLMQYGPNIEGVSLKFALSDHRENENMHLQLANELYQMKKLKYLALDTCGTDITDFLKRMAKRNALKYLTLTNVTHKINEGFDAAFCNMSNLKVLRMNIHFYFHFGQDLYKTLCKNLVNLEELHLISCDMDVQQIGDIINNSINLKKLYLPPFNRIHNGMLCEDMYVGLVKMQRRKNVDFPLTIFLELFSFPNVTFFIPSDVLQMYSNVINFSKFNPSHFDDYLLPHFV